MKNMKRIAKLVGLALLLLICATGLAAAQEKVVVNPCRLELGPECPLPTRDCPYLCIDGKCPVGCGWTEWPTPNTPIPVYEYNKNGELKFVDEVTPPEGLTTRDVVFLVWTKLADGSPALEYSFVVRPERVEPAR